jgi:hypothetical protein
LRQVHPDALASSVHRRAGAAKATREARLKDTDNLSIIGEIGHCERRDGECVDGSAPIAVVSDELLTSCIKGDPGMAGDAGTLLAVVFTTCTGVA